MNNRAAKQLLLAVATALAVTSAFALLTLFIMQGNFGHEAGIAVAVGTLYVLPLLALQAVTEKQLRRWADAAPFPMDWIVYGGAKLVLALAAAGIGSLLTLLLGIVPHWSNLYMANRAVVVVTPLAALLIRLYATTRSHLEERNRQLEETVAAEARNLRQHEQEAERAREIQQALMPRELPRIKGCQLAAECIPARQVGGDYFDAIRLGDSRVAIAIADVSGKGMGAALLMSNLQAIVRAFAPAVLAPQELCTRANQLIAANVAPGKYITFFFAVVDTARMRIDYCNAGHNPPLLGRRDGSVETLDEGGPVLGILPDAPYDSGSAELRPGDGLVLYTDGITEATDSSGDEFGEERLKALLARRPSGAEELRARIVSAVSEFANGNFSDDVTVLVVTVD
ncbi:MAG: PP2C family protein-serine/threonine phosphatase [Terracidiphilus sp.]|jgi:serine phosphatase RsbU (regulator of sigma subunit)